MDLLWSEDDERFRAELAELLLTCGAEARPPTVPATRRPRNRRRRVLPLVAPAAGSEEYALIGKARQIVFLTENVAAKYKDWHNRGVQFDRPPQTALFGSVLVNFEDVDGNRFSLIEFDQATRLVEEQRRRTEEILEAERRAIQEQEIARQVQARLFPQRQPAMHTLEYAGTCIQAHQVGGDYHDFIDLGRERLGLVIGDISGKGIAAALLMANLQANLRSLSAIALDEPERLLRSVNQLFCENTTDGAFATLFFAEYNDATRGLRYANCGHLAALLLHCNDSFERLESTATVLGVFKKWDCAISEIQISPGDIFALYTDGITESFNDADEEFGEERLAAVLCRHRALPSNDLLAAIVDEVHRFSPREQHDDITLIVAKSL